MSDRSSRARPEPSNPVTPAQDLQGALSELLAGGAVQVYEDGELLAELSAPAEVSFAQDSASGSSALQYEVKQQGHAAFLHLWSEERNLTRRVLRVVEHSADGLVLEVQRFGKSKPGQLEFSRSEGRGPGRMTREKFRARFARLLAEQFPDEETESLTSAPDLEHSFSGSYTRGVLCRGQRAWAVLGVSGAEDASTIDAALTYGLLWLDWARMHAGRRVVEGLRMILPEGAARVTAHRLQAIISDANIALYELSEATLRFRKVDPRDAGNLDTWLTPRREVEATRAAAQDAVQRVQRLAPDAIDAIVPPGTREVALRFRGLEFARWRNGELRLNWPGSGHASVEEALKELATFRNALATDKNHPLYRASPERWLETTALADITRIDPRLDPKHVYPQVPALSGTGTTSAGAGRGVIDLLGVTRDGRVAVIELKASEDIHLALQGMDYWLRVRWHLQQGDFQRYGYFTGVELQHKPPLLYLVAPGLRFHPATDVLLRYVSPEVEPVRVGLNEEWRRGIQVVFRQ